MQASDVMVRDVATVGPETGVDAAVKLLVDHDISALPVIGDDGRLIGIISEADLIRRAEIDTDKHRPWWLESMTAASTLAADFTKSHGKKVGEIMTTDVVSVAEDASLSEIATLFERKRIKRVPVLKDGHLVGIVSRSNLIQALASRFHADEEPADADRHIRLELLARMKEQDWTGFGDRNVIVKDGVVHLWGLVGTAEERAALIAMAEGVPGVVRIADEMIPAY
jgi:CBS domain-containing protein